MQATRPFSSQTICSDSESLTGALMARLYGCGSLLDPEPVEQRVVGAPVAAYPHREVEVHVRVELALELAPGRGADGLDHAPAGADEDALLGLGLDPGERADADE